MNPTHDEGPSDPRTMLAQAYAQACNELRQAQANHINADPTRLFDARAVALGPEYWSVYQAQGLSPQEAVGAADERSRLEGQAEADAS